MSNQFDFKDLIKCSICTDTLKNPRILPCLHTFCLSCLEGLTNFQPCLAVHCPICGLEYILPTDGVASIPKNFFIEKFSNPKFKGTTLTMDIIYDKSNSAKQQKLCMEHCGKNLDLYCESCKCILCILCYTESHLKHNVKDFKNLVEKLLNQNVYEIQENIFKCKLLLELLKDQESKCLSDAEIISAEIDKKCTNLINIIKGYHYELLQKLDIFKKEEFKRIAYLSNDVEAKINVLMSLVKSSEELANKTYKIDLIKGFDELKKSADKIIDEKLEDLIVNKVCPNYMFCDMYESADIYIKHILGDIIKNKSKDLLIKNIGCDSLFEMKITKNLTGENKLITIKTEKIDILKTKIKPISEHIFQKMPISMTIAGCSMYLLFEESSDVDIYDKDTMTKKGTIYIPELKYPSKIVFVNKHLLINEYQNDILHCVNLKNLKFTRWKSSIQYIKNLLPLLNNNILISGSLSNTMIENKVTGTHVRDITLTKEIMYIYQVCVIDEERLLISYETKDQSYNISTINENGDILLTFNVDNHIFSDYWILPILSLKADHVTYCLIYNWRYSEFYVIDDSLNFLKQLDVQEDAQQLDKFKLSSYWSIFMDSENNIYLFNSFKFNIQTMAKYQLLE